MNSLQSRIDSLVRQFPSFQAFYRNLEKQAENKNISGLPKMDTIDQWWKGRTQPRADHLRVFCDSLRLSLNWLLLGIGPKDLDTFQKMGEQDWLKQALDELYYLFLLERKNGRWKKSRAKPGSISGLSEEPSSFAPESWIAGSAEIKMREWYRDLLNEEVKERAKDIQPDRLPEIEHKIDQYRDELERLHHNYCELSAQLDTRDYHLMNGYFVPQPVDLEGKEFQVQQWRQELQRKEDELFKFIEANK